MQQEKGGNSISTLGQQLTTCTSPKKESVQKRYPKAKAVVRARK
jgi:hypothetical protein